MDQRHALFTTLQASRPESRGSPHKHWTGYTDSLELVRQCWMRVERGEDEAGRSNEEAAYLESYRQVTRSDNTDGQLVM